MRFFWFLIFFLNPFFIFSSPVGNPSAPSMLEEGFCIPDIKALNFRVGYQICNTQDLELKFDETNQDNDLYFRKINSYSNTCLFFLNVKERLDIYAELGSLKLKPTFEYKNDIFNSESENNLLLRSGMKLILIEIKDFSFAFDVKYSIFNTYSSFLTKNDKLVDESLKFKLNEWQIAVGLCQKISILRPYIGIAYRNSKVKIKNHLWSNDLNLIYKKKAGLYLGSSVSVGSYVLINGEVRLINERSTIISLELRF